jgi:polyphosphate kinase
MSKADLTYDNRYTQNREVSWLRFNQRVMEEAEDASVPLMERLKFLAIFTTNLDEFFMIRVGSLMDLSHLKKDPFDNKTGWTPKEQLDRVFREVAPLYVQRDRLFAMLEKELAEKGVYQVSLDQLSGGDRKNVETHFRRNILPLLSPQIIDAHHPFPHLWNKMLYGLATVRYKNRDPIMGLVSIPAVLPKLFRLPGEVLRYVRTEQIVLRYLPEIFASYEVTDGCLICVTRNADIHPEDEAFDFDEDFRNHMKQILKKRSKLAPVRMEVEGRLEKKLGKVLMQRLDLTPEQVYECTGPITFDYATEIKALLPEDLREVWSYPPFVPRWPVGFDPASSTMNQVLKKDLLLFYPYDSMEPFLHLLRESAVSAKVQSIQITIYRLAPDSKIIEYLSDAAENGKAVTVLIELRARFDEKNNIAWAERLEDAGCKVIYGVNDCKVHSKICLITMVDKGKISYITQVGTGNYNEETAKLYTDLSLLTANAAIGADAAAFFKNMAIANVDGEYKHLLVAPYGFQKVLMDHIDDEMIKTRRGGKGKILLKMNALTERRLIDKLAQASCAGVEIILMIRGICCLLPGIPGKTENIRVISTVGRFLEHPRIYCFGSGKTAKIYLSSADLMTRNMYHRVEIACPVWDPDCRKRIIHLLEVGLKDTAKSRELSPTGTFFKPQMTEESTRFDSQAYFVVETMTHEGKSRTTRSRAGQWKWKVLAALWKKIAK